ncbi:MAG: hypothetical protein IIA92_06620 [Chloroflexi bacterium]|nr:hypothetical protein [Chloroflexota bacterium]
MQASSQSFLPLPTNIGLSRLMFFKLGDPLMRRMKVLAAAMVVLGVLMLGADLAYTGSDSNAKVNVEGPVVSIPWVGIDDLNGAAGYYPTFAIAITVPPYIPFSEFQKRLIAHQANVERTAFANNEKPALPGLHIH